jgi:hypothetical protein
MGAIGIKKKLVVELDIINGTTDVINDDEMSYVEIMGALEYAKMMIIKDWMESQ